MSVFKQDAGSNKQWGEINTFGRTWLFVTSEIPVNTCDLYFEALHCRIFEEGEADNTGGIQLTFEEYDCVFAEVNILTGDIVATSEAFECIGTGTVVGVTGDLELNFVEPNCSMQAGLGVSCFFEPFEISMQEAVNMADMNVTFKEPDSLLSGVSTYVFMDLKMEKFEGDFTPGVQMSATMEDLTCEITGMSGKVASLAATGLSMTADLVGGPLPYIDAELKEFVFTAAGFSSVKTGLTLTFKKAGIALTGESLVNAVLDARFNQMALTLAGQTHPVGSISITFLPLRTIGGAGGQVISAELDGKISLLRMLANMQIDGPNNVDLEFKDYEGAFTDDGGDCALADTLSFGG